MLSESMMLLSERNLLPLYRFFPGLIMINISALITSYYEEKYIGQCIGTLTGIAEEALKMDAGTRKRNLKGYLPRDLNKVVT